MLFLLGIFLAATYDQACERVVFRLRSHNPVWPLDTKDRAAPLSGAALSLA